MKILLLIFFFTLGEIIIAQQNNLKDYFPLSIGNNWKYYFILENSTSMTHSAGKDEGWIEYEIISKSYTDGETIWNVFQKRDFTRSSFISYQWYYQSIKDSATFHIIESDSGFHELYTTIDDPESVFPFKYTDADTSKFFRYHNIELPSEITLKIEYKDPYNPSFPYYNYKYNFTQKADTGITELIYTKSAMLSRSSAKYYLNEFTESSISNTIDEQPIASSIHLYQNYPNPFNPTTTIRYTISESGFVSIKVYDLNGKEIATLINEVKEIGNYQVEFDGSKLSSGAYFYQLRIGNTKITHKMILLK